MITPATISYMLPAMLKLEGDTQRRRNAPIAPVCTYAYESVPVNGLRKRKTRGCWL